MPDIVADCKLIGNSFEDMVAWKLESMGFATYRHLYIPYNPTSDKYTEIDIVAIRNSVVFAVECKNMSGRLAGDFHDKTWTWYAHGRETTVANPFRQSWSHRKALVDNLHIVVHDIIVINNTLKWDCEECGRVATFTGLKQWWKQYVGTSALHPTWTPGLLYLLSDYGRSQALR